jgi:predicted AAA+ superfamily ATPase
MMQRLIYNKLEQWKQNDARKVLMLRGARQVGKTHAVRHLAASFNRYLEVNLEEERSIHSFFEGSLDPFRLCEKLSNYYNEPITPGETLLFLDEIQACPAAIGALQFFYEKMPALHVVSAGSLLEFALEQIPSLGVGRISSLFMYPMSFREFLVSIGEDGPLRMMIKASPANPLESAFHHRLLDALKIYLLIGGMPEVVKTYARTRNLKKCQEVLSDLLVTLRDDFAKYKKRFPVSRLQDVFESIVFQAGGKFKYSAVNPQEHSVYIKEALGLLIKAGLAYKILHTDARGIPLGAQVNPKKFKVMLVDLGLHQRVLGLDVSEYLTSNDFDVINKGSLAELFVGQELISKGSEREPANLFYWHREARSSNAEVDFVIQHEGSPLPIEVKSGGTGRMQSIQRFLQERNLKKGIRTSMEHFGKVNDIDIIPLYAIWNI